MSQLRLFTGFKTLGFTHIRSITPGFEFWKVPFRGKKSECWMPVCGVVVRKVPIDDSREKCRINTFLMQNLFQDDPLMVAAGVNKNDPDPGLIQFYSSSMNDDKSLYATIDMTREIIGVVIARHTNHQTARELHRLARHLTYDESGKYMETLALVEEKANVYRSYNSPKALSIDCLCIGRNFRRRGVAKMLLKTAREIAGKDQVAKIMKFACPNIYGGRAALICGGMKLHSTKAPNEYKDEKGRRLIANNLCPPHKNIDLFVSDLRRTNDK